MPSNQAIDPLVDNLFFLDKQGQHSKLFQGIDIK
jgi:hypothetical protein